MKREPARVVLRYLRTMIPSTGAGDPTDRQLLERFATGRDEAAFAALVHRHGPLVWGVCRRLLRHHQDAEDAFQATFLVLAGKAGAIRRPELLANWLYGVACRTAARARADASRRRARERTAATAAVVMPSTDILWQDIRPILDEEIQRLPTKYRTPFVLCYLEGRTNEEAARQLGCPKGTILSRLAWARQWLRRRLERRGVSLAVGGVAAFLEQQAAPATVSARLAETTVDAILAHTAGKFVAGGVVAAGPAILAQGVLNQMLLTQLKAAAVAVLLIGAVGFGAWTYAGQGGKSTSASAAPAAPSEDRSAPRQADPDIQLARRQLEAAIQELLQVQADIRKAKVEMALAEADQKKAARRPIPDEEIEHWIDQPVFLQGYMQQAKDVRARVDALNKQVKDVRARVDALKSVLAGGQENPLYKQQASRLEELNKELARRRRHLRSLGEDELRQQLTAPFQSKVASLQNRLAYLQGLEKALNTDIQRLSQQTRSQEASTEERLRTLEKGLKEVKTALEMMKKSR